MARKHRPWVIRDNKKARCDHCGAASVWMPLQDFRSSCTGRPKRYDMWYWWNQFKKRHNQCAKRVDSGSKV